MTFTASCCLKTVAVLQYNKNRPEKQGNWLLISGKGNVFQMSYSSGIGTYFNYSIEMY